MTCGCGQPADCRLEVQVRSKRGVGTRIERRCVRCIDELAWRLLAQGFRFLSVKRDAA